MIEKTIGNGLIYVPMSNDTRHRLYHRGVQNPKFGLATKEFRAIDLSCRACGACGAGAGVLGLGFLVGGTFGFAPPTSD